MNGKTSAFPLEPLRAMRVVRKRILENDLQRCRHAHAEAEARRDEAETRLRSACVERQEYCVQTWRRLFNDGTPTGLATSRYKKHLALLDQRIDACQQDLQVCEADVAETLATVEAAAVIWRRASRKLDAVEQMKQCFARDARHRVDIRDEQAVEELLLRRGKVV